MFYKTTKCSYFTCFFRQGHLAVINTYITNNFTTNNKPIDINENLVLKYQPKWLNTPSTIPTA